MRIDVQLCARLREAAQLTGVSESDLVRDAIGARVDALLGDRLDRRLSDKVGVVSGGSGRSRRTGEAFTEVLRRRR